MWHLRKTWIMRMINMHCYLMQWLLTAASTLNVFCSVSKSVLCLIIVLCFDWFFLKLVVPALWRGEYSEDDNFVEEQWSPFCHSQSSAVLWHTSISVCDARRPQQPQNNDCQSHCRIFELQLWNEVKLNVCFLHEALVKKADGIELSHSVSHLSIQDDHWIQWSLHADTRPVWPQSDISPVISFWDGILSE